MIELDAELTERRFCSWSMRRISLSMSAEHRQRSVSGARLAQLSEPALDEREHEVDEFPGLPNLPCTIPVNDWIRRGTDWASLLFLVDATDFAFNVRRPYQGRALLSSPSLHLMSVSMKLMNFPGSLIYHRQGIPGDPVLRVWNGRHQSRWIMSAPAGRYRSMRPRDLAQLSEPALDEREHEVDEFPGLPNLPPSQPLFNTQRELLAERIDRSGNRSGYWKEVVTVVD
jgi:hypothetical protein